jgi:eukaryotic-like serine/threonine-protein kinase
MVHDLQPGDPQLIGPYRLRGVLGAGGMGRVFLGVSADGRPVAVKVVRADLATDPDFRALFRQEVAVARTVSGPFTAPVIDADLDGPVPWLATAYVAGSSLAHAVAGGGPLPPGVVLVLAGGLAEGLNAIHAAGVVHRDLKPSNVLLAPDGPRLIDFGISRASGATALADPDLMIGSPGFMSPEQAEGRQVGPPSDIFSLGAVLAFAAAGEGPFGPGSTVALIYRVIHRPANLDHLPREVRGLVERCLVKDPALRPTARDLMAATRAARSVTIRLPGPVTHTFIQRPPLARAPEAVTTPLSAPVPAGQALVAPDLPPSMAARPANTTAAGQAAPRPPQDRPQQRQDRPSRGRHWRPLTAAAIIAGLLGAAAAADLAMTAAHHRAPAAQSERPVAAARTPAPAISSADPRTSPSAAVRKRSAARTPPSSRPDSGIRLASSTPVADIAPPTSANPPAASSARPSGAASPTRRPYPSPSASPRPSATPTPTSGGYGY